MGDRPPRPIRAAAGSSRKRRSGSPSAARHLKLVPAAASLLGAAALFLLAVREQPGPGPSAPARYPQPPASTAQPGGPTAEANSALRLVSVGFAALPGWGE